MATSHLRSVEAKAFVSARDFELSQRFYQAIGFSLVWSSPDLAHFRHGSSCFLLQNFHVDECTKNFKMHLWVEDVDSWWSTMSSECKQFGFVVGPPEDRPWGMRDFTVIDPSGVLWRIGEPLPSAR